MKKLLSSLLGASLALTACAAFAQADSGGRATTKSHKKQVIGYITQWDAWKANSAGLPAQGALNHLNVDYSKYTMLNWSFFGVAKDGSIHSGDYRNKKICEPGTSQEPNKIFHTDTYSSWDLWLLFGELELVQSLNKTTVEKCKKAGFDVSENGTNWKHPDWGLEDKLPVPLPKGGNGKGLLAMAKEKGVKVVGSIGGWSMCRHIPEVMADSTKRAKLVSECQRLIKIGFDGIDLDWEYPGPYDGMNFKGSEADYGNYLTFMQEVRAAIGADKIITGCFSADVKKLKGFNWAELAKVMDYFNFMTYDFNGGWCDKTGHNAPISDNGTSERDDFNYDAVLKFVKENNVDLARVNFGAPFYGRGVICDGAGGVGAKTVKRDEDIQPDGKIKTCADYTNWPKDVYDGTPNYFFIKQKTKDWTHGVDEKAKVPFCTKNSYFLSYDDEKSIGQKAQFIKDANLAGIIVWTVFGDMEFGSAAGSFGKLKKYSVKTPLINKVNEVFGGYDVE